MVTTSKRSRPPGQNLSRSQGWALALASVASFMVVLDMLVVTTALNTIRRDLGASIAQLEWTVNAYTLTFAVLLMTASAIGDRFGRRRVFAAGLALFTVASVGCAIAPGVGWLIAARTVQGAGAAMVMPLALAVQLTVVAACEKDASNAVKPSQAYEFQNFIGCAPYRRWHGTERCPCPARGRPAAAAPSGNGNAPRSSSPPPTCRDRNR